MTRYYFHIKDGADQGTELLTAEEAKRSVSVVKLLQILCQAQVLLKMGQRLTSPGFQFGVLAAF
jgi:hypothetical protein